MNQSAMTDKDFLPGLIIVVVCILIYFVPTFIAVLRSHHNTAPIAIVNFFFGWTALGYVICLAWAFSATNRNINVTLQHTQVPYGAAPPARVPPSDTTDSGAWRQSLLIFAVGVILVMFCVWAVQRFDLQALLK
jgi:hypothetical protein